jgi:hypothetical protein
MAQAKKVVVIGAGPAGYVCAIRRQDQSPRFDPTGAVLTVTGPEYIRSFQLGDQPGTLGAAPSSNIPLPAAPGVAQEHARFWWRDRKLMLHHLATGQETIVNGKHIVWTSIEDGDEFWIGPYLVQMSQVNSVPGLRDERTINIDARKPPATPANLVLERS